MLSPKKIRTEQWTPQTSFALHLHRFGKMQHNTTLKYLVIIKTKQHIIKHPNKLQHHTLGELYGHCSPWTTCYGDNGYMMKIASAHRSRALK